MNELLIIMVYVFIFALCVGGTYALRKYNINKEDIKIFMTVINIGDYITKKFNFKYNEGINKMISYVLEAIKCLDEYNNIKDLEQKRLLIKENALKICKDNNIKIDINVVNIIDEVVNYIIDNNLIEL